MSAVQSETSAKRLPTRGAPFIVPTADIEQHWPAIEFVLKQAEAWTQVLSAADIYECLKDGRAQAWGVVDQDDQLTLAITRCADCARGRICTAWVFIPQPAQDDASIAAFLESVEAYARSRTAVALEIFAAPWVGQKVTSNLARSKVTAVDIELDLRVSRRTN